MDYSLTTVEKVTDSNGVIIGHTIRLSVRAIYHIERSKVCSKTHMDEDILNKELYQEYVCLLKEMYAYRDFVLFVMNKCVSNKEAGEFFISSEEIKEILKHDYLIAQRFAALRDRVVDSESIDTYFSLTTLYSYAMLILRGLMDDNPLKVNATKTAIDRFIESHN